MPGHDQRFKNLLESFLPDLLALVVPELARMIEPSSLKFLRTEQFLDPPEGDVVHADLLAELRLRKPHGGNGRFLVHVEIERHWSAAMADRMWRYGQAIRRRHHPPLYSLVLFLRGGEGCIRSETWDVKRPEGYPGPTPVTIRYWSFALANCSAEDYLERSEPLAWALAALMKSTMAPEVLKLECVRRIVHTPLTPDRQHLLLDCVDAYVTLNSSQERRFQTMLTEQLDPKVLAYYQTETEWAKRLKAQERIEGREEGMRNIMTSILRQRFGQVPASSVQRLESMTAEQLEVLSHRLLTAESLEELGLL